MLLILLVMFVVLVLHLKILYDSIQLIRMRNIELSIQML